MIEQYISENEIVVFQFQMARHDIGHNIIHIFNSMTINYFGGGESGNGGSLYGVDGRGGFTGLGSWHAEP